MLTQFTVPVMMVSRRVVLMAAVVTGRILDSGLFVAITGVTVPSLTLPYIRLLPGAAAKVTCLHSKYLKRRDRQDGQADQ